jgi:hypothetical protein
MDTYIIEGDWAEIHDYVTKFPKQTIFCIAKTPDQKVYLRSPSEFVISAVLHKFAVMKTEDLPEFLESSSTFGHLPLFFPKADHC